MTVAGTAGPEPVRTWRRLADGRAECGVCPRHCRLRPGQRGYCAVVRGNLEGVLVLLARGRASGFAVDPIEKKPLTTWPAWRAATPAAPPAATC